jgi:hypothetical protein
MDDAKDKAPKQDQATSERIRRRRSVAIALTLAFMVFAFYFATFVRLGGTVPPNSF